MHVYHYARTSGGVQAAVGASRDPRGGAGSAAARRAVRRSLRRGPPGLRAGVESYRSSRWTVLRLRPRRRSRYAGDERRVVELALERGSSATSRLRSARTVEGYNETTADRRSSCATGSNDCARICRRPRASPPRPALKSGRAPSRSARDLGRRSPGGALAIIARDGRRPVPPAVFRPGTSGAVLSSPIWWIGIAGKSVSPSASTIGSASDPTTSCATSRAPSLISRSLALAWWYPDRTR